MVLSTPILYIVCLPAYQKAKKYIFFGVCTVDAIQKKSFFHLRKIVVYYQCREGQHKQITVPDRREYRLQ